MNAKCKKIVSLIEKLQKYRADHGIKQHPLSFKTLFALRQTKAKETPNE